MYLTAGLFKGNKIEVPKSAKPTLSKVRESVFNILMPDFKEGQKFLDMFAGSAIMGLEALSRGYTVKELEINPKSAALIRKNYEKIRQKPDLTVVNSLNYKTEEKFDVIYLDPPWDADYSVIIKKACSLLSPEGKIVAEFDDLKKIDIEKITKENNLPLEVVKSKKYGRVRIEILSFVN